MSIDRADDEAPTELELALSESSTGEIKLSLRGDPLPADSEPRTLEPRMTVHRSTGMNPRPRAPTLSTIITPSEPFRVVSSAKVAVAKRAKFAAPASDEEEETATATRAPVTVDETEVDPRPPAVSTDEEVATDTRPPIDLAAYPAAAKAPVVDPPDDVTDVSGPGMLSSSDLLTDPELQAVAVPTLASSADDDDRDGPGGTAKILVTPPPPPAVVRPPVGTPLPEAAAPFVAPAETASPPPAARDPKARARRAMIIAVVASLGALGAVILLASVLPSSRPSTDAASAPSSVPSSAAVLASAVPAPVASAAVPPAIASAAPVELDSPPPAPVMTPTPLATAEPATAATAATASEKPRSASPPPRPPARPPSRPPVKRVSPAASQKGWAPLHI